MDDYEDGKKADDAPIGHSRVEEDSLFAPSWPADPGMCASLLTSLDLLTVPASARRVISGSGLCLGITCAATGSYLSPFSRQPEWASVASLANVALREAIGAYPFEASSLVINVDSVAARHTDSNNTGPSILLLLGSFEGGSFCYEGGSSTFSEVGNRFP